MTSKLVRFLIATALVSSLTALAQTAGSDNALPAAPSSTPASTSAAPTPMGNGTKIAVINIEGAIYASNEGQKDFDVLGKKLEPKQAELKTMNDELEALKKQLTTQGDKLNADAHDTLVRQIDAKQKVFDRTMQDARDDFQAQQGEIAQKILQKMGPLIKKYADDNGYGLIIDTTQPWPQGPVVMAGPSFDITKAIVDAYNVQSGVAAPPASATRTAPSHSSTGATAKPATGAAPK
jgi:outer membrane protein